MAANRSHDILAGTHSLAVTGGGTWAINGPHPELPTLNKGDGVQIALMHSTLWNVPALSYELRLVIYWIVLWDDGEWFEYSQDRNGPVLWTAYGTWTPP